MDNTVSKEHVSFIIAEAQRRQIKNPTRACVNSEAAFVAQRLRNEGYVEISAAYWSWTCRSASRSEEQGSLEFGKEVFELQKQLRAIDAGFNMPSWGTYGT